LNWKIIKAAANKKFIKYPKFRRSSVSEKGRLSIQSRVTQYEQFKLKVNEDQKQSSITPLPPEIEPNVM
jgi:hypothetical protein